MQYLIGGCIQTEKGSHTSSLLIIANRLGELGLYDSQHECFMQPGTTLYTCTVLHVQVIAIYLIQSVGCTVSIVTWGGKHDVNTNTCVQTFRFHLFSS